MKRKLPKSAYTLMLLFISKGNTIFAVRHHLFQDIIWSRSSLPAVR